MNWIILIVAGLFEAAFAFCLGKAKTATGSDIYFWYAGFLITLIISMVLCRLRLRQHLNTLTCRSDLFSFPGLSQKENIILQK